MPIAPSNRGVRTRAPTHCAAKADKLLVTSVRFAGPGRQGRVAENGIQALGRSTTRWRPTWGLGADGDEAGRPVHRARAAGPGRRRPRRTRRTAGHGPRWPGAAACRSWNGDPRPFVWKKTAEEILDSLARYLQRISGGGTLTPTQRPAPRYDPNYSSGEPSINRNHLGILFETRRTLGDLSCNQEPHSLLCLI
jgi:hypothetical protein